MVNLNMAKENRVEFEVKVTHFYELEYSEGEKKMRVSIDFREPFIDLAPICLSNWEPPFDKLEITKKDEQRILSNLYTFFRNDIRLNSRKIYISLSNQ